MDVKNIVLVGFMGTGKSSVGKILSKKLQRPLIDVDEHIEEMEKRKICDIFEKEGEAHFRSLEKDAIRWAAEKEAAVIITGGGAVLDPENVEALKTKGILVALLATHETIFKRVRNSKHRPLLGGKDMFSEIKRLMEVRAPYYDKADYKFQTDGLSSAQVAEKIMGALR